MTIDEGEDLGGSWFYIGKKAVLSERKKQGRVRWSLAASYLGVSSRLVRLH